MLDAWAGSYVEVADPGDGNSIHTNLESAFSSASSGELVLLPKGNFTVEDGTNKTIYLQDTGKDNIHIRGMGGGFGGTKLKRGEVVEHDHMMSIQADNHIEISDIWFQGPKPRLYPGDNGYTTNRIYGIDIGNTNVYLHDCKFSWFSRYIIRITIRPYAGTFNSVVSNNEFIDNYTIDNEGKINAGECIAPIRTAEGDTTWEDVSPGDSTFVFIEDNYFSGQMSPVVGGWGGLYVFRHNYVERNEWHGCLNMHGGSENHGDATQLPTRMIEVYENTFVKATEDDPINSGQADEGIIISFGGEAVVWNNIIDGYSTGMTIAVWEGKWDTDYPADWYMAGYTSGVNYGPDHTGTDPDTYGEDDWFIWDNTYKNMEGSPKLSVKQPEDNRYIQEGRDYHFVARPNYTPYTYPHPLAIDPRRKKSEIKEI
jgi:hypothetical protein